MSAKAAKLSPAAGQLTFADSEDISPWAEGSVLAMVNRGTMKGYHDNTFRPRGNATRAEAVTVVLGLIT